MFNTDFYRTVILADGNFPKHVLPVSALNSAEKIICCDGAADGLITTGREPDAIIGDMDSISPATRSVYKDRLVEINEQDTNDLEKALNWCLQKGISDVTILGATGKREDHTLGNIFLLDKFTPQLNLTMLTDAGRFICFSGQLEIGSFPGQAVSIFSTDPQVKITSTNLKYELNELHLTSLNSAILNECTSTSFSLRTVGGKVLVFTQYKGI